VSVALKSPADDAPRKATFLRWIWYAARRETAPRRCHRRILDTCAGADGDANRRGAGIAVESHRSAGTDPARENGSYGADEVVQYVGEVPTVMTFLIEGSIRLTTTTRTFGHSAQPAGGRFIPRADHLTRQPSLSGAYALEE